MDLIPTHNAITAQDYFSRENMSLILHRMKTDVITSYNALNQGTKNTKVEISYPSINVTLRYTTWCMGCDLHAATSTYDHTLSLSIMQATSYIPAHKLFSVNILSIHSLTNTLVSVHVVTAVLS